MAHTVTPMHCGTIRLDKSILTTQVDSGRTVAAPTVCYLVEGDSDREPMLVDTSFGDVAVMAERQPAFDCSRPDGHTVDAQLAAHGYAPEEIETVVLTHLHWDHCYNLEQFTGAEILVQREEIAYAVAPYPMHAGGYEAPTLGLSPPWEGVEFTPIDGETELAPGIVAFPTPGHTVGHQSLAVATETDETTVVAADAVPTFENLAGTERAKFVRGLAVNDFEWWNSAEEVVARGDVVLPGHEWEILDASPPPGEGW